MLFEYQDETLCVIISLSTYTVLGTMSQNSVWQLIQPERKTGCGRGGGSFGMWCGTLKDSFIDFLQPFACDPGILPVKVYIYSQNTPGRSIRVLEPNLAT